MPDQVLRLGLIYKGPDVKDGALAVEDMISALQGFSSAYEKIANLEGETAVQHRIRVIAIEHNSADLIIGVWQWLKDNAEQLSGVKILTGAASAVVAGILGVIKLKKLTAGKTGLPPISCTPR